MRSSAHSKAETKMKLVIILRMANNPILLKLESVESKNPGSYPGFNSSRDWTIPVLSGRSSRVKHTARVVKD